MECARCGTVQAAGRIEILNMHFISGLTGRDGIRPVTSDNTNAYSPNPSKAKILLPNHSLRL